MAPQGARNGCDTNDPIIVATKPPWIKKSLFTLRCSRRRRSDGRACGGASGRGNGSPAPCEQRRNFAIEVGVVRHVRVGVGPALAPRAARHATRAV